MLSAFGNLNRTPRPTFPAKELSDWVAHPLNLIIAVAAIVFFIGLIAVLMALMPHAAFAQTAGGDTGAILNSAENYMLTTVGVPLASLGFAVIAILLFVGQHRYEAILLAIFAVGVYFGAPGMIHTIAGV
jgi:type IV secretory pathway VirB2 component (pilin)